MARKRTLGGVWGVGCVAEIIPRSAIVDQMYMASSLTVDAYGAWKRREDAQITGLWLWREKDARGLDGIFPKGWFDGRRRIGRFFH